MQVNSVNVNNAFAFNTPIDDFDVSTNEDLFVSDPSGNVLVEFENGHIMTQNFNSNFMPFDDSLSDLNIGDSNGYVIAQFKDGHIKTKNFDSRNNDQNFYFNNINLALAAQKRRKNDSYWCNSQNNHSHFATIVHITDLHGDSVRTSRAFDVAEILNAAVVCTGDMVRYNPTDDYSWMSNIINSFNGKYIHCVGNHDLWNLSNANQFANNKYFVPFAGTKNWVLPSGVSYPTYCYYDDSDYKIRYISINQFENGDYGGQYSQSQVDFLLDSLLNIPSNYGVIVLMHSPELKPVKTNNYDKFFDDETTSGTKFWSGLNPVFIKDVIDAFISKTQISRTYEENPSNITVNADFSNVSSNEFICYITGHLHCDNVYYVTNTQNTQLMLNETCTNAWVNTNTDGTPGTNYPYYTEPADLSRQYDTINQDAFNVYVVDRENSSIRIVRIGSDMPCHFNKPRRDYMLISYK